MKQIFRRFKSAVGFRRRGASVYKGHTSSVVHRYRARKKKQFLIAVGVVAAAVMVPILATAAYGDEIFHAPEVVEQVQQAQETQIPSVEPTPTPTLAVEPGLVFEGTQGEEPTDDSSVQAQGETEAVSQPTPAPEEAIAPEAAPSAEETPSAETTQAPEATQAPEETPAQAPEATQTPEQTQAPAAEQQAPAAEQAAAAAPVQNERQKLYTGDIQPETTDPLIATLQSRLMELHYMDEDEPTEFFGPLTKQAVSYFQRKHGLEVTGVATYDTLQALFADDAKPYTVMIGASGTDVEEIQKRLDSLGYDVSATGYFGTDTEGAVKAFQKNNELGIDGNVGYYTKEALYSSDAITASGEEAGSSRSGDSDESASSSTLERFIDVLEDQLGKPYVLGAKGPNAFDCSGLIYYALNQAGYDIDYMTSAGWRSSGFTTIKSIGDLQRGDIICMSGHVAVYMGDGTVIDASSSQNAMMHRDFGSWFKNGFIHAKRVF